MPKLKKLAFEALTLARLQTFLTKDCGIKRQFSVGELKRLKKSLK